mgnify:CR=1 FL=1
MARRKSKRKVPVFRSFNVIYEDGSVTSNRRVASNLLDQSYGDALEDLVLKAITEQDLQIAERSGNPRAKIKSITPA